MSEKLRPAKRPPDPRVERTRDRLGDALIALIQEKPFDEVTVQDVLARAQVSRSTFYQHFRDKDDLFVSDAEKFLAHVCGQLAGDLTTERVLPIRELFEHVADRAALRTALQPQGRYHDFLALCQGEFARAIERRLAELPRAAGIAPERRAVLAHALAGSALALMEWWMDKDARPTPAAMDTLCHEQVWHGAR